MVASKHVPSEQTRFDSQSISYGTPGWYVMCPTQPDGFWASISRNAPSRLGAVHANFVWPQISHAGAASSLVDESPQPTSPAVNATANAQNANGREQLAMVRKFVRLTA